jgi:copper homeostasis protein
METTALEICIDDVAGAVIAERCDANRIELCANLAQGGTTPDLATVRGVLSVVTDTDVQVLIRPRPGDFVYSAAEVDTMVRDIETIKALPRPAGVTVGFVVGGLTGDARIDVRAMSRLLMACGASPVTFHRAFDAVDDQFESMDAIVGLGGFGRVLTSGGQPTALAGIHRLAALVERARDTDVSILVAGGVRAHNVAEIVRRTGTGEVHLRASTDSSSSGSSSTSAEVILAVTEALGKPRPRFYASTRTAQ